MVVELFIAGLQEPVIPLFEVPGRAAIAAPEQYGPTPVNVGVMKELTVISTVVDTAH